MQTILIDDFQRWEMFYLDPFVRRMTEALGGRVEVCEKAGSIPVHAPLTWIVTRDWRAALDRIKRSRGSRVYLSVFDSRGASRSVYRFLWRSIRPTLPYGVRLLTHHPLSHRYLIEMEGCAENCVVTAPLPYPNFLAPTVRGEPSKSFGILSSLDEEANLNFVVTVAHRLLKQDAGMAFKVFGDGPLRGHLTRMVADLGLADRCQIVPAFSLDDLTGMGLCLYLPIRTDSFIPLLTTVALLIPTLCMQSAGLDEILGPLAVPNIKLHDTEELSKTATSILFNAPARRHQQQAMQAGLSQRFGWEKAVTFYADLFGVVRGLYSKPVAAA